MNLDRLTAAENLLRDGKWDRGWRAWELARAELSHYLPHVIPPGFGDAPEVDERFSLRNVTVLVLHEGGWGDAFMAARWAASLANEGAKVIWQAPPACANLMRTAPGMHRVIDRPTPVKAGRWIRVLSLPARYGMHRGAPVPYLRVPRWYKLWKWPSGKPLVGIRIKSGPLTPGGEDRDLPPHAAH